MKVDFQYLYFELTRLCNHYCIQCFNNSRYKLGNELNVEDTIGLIQSFKDQGGKKLQLTGGEALTKSSIEVILKAVKDLNFDHVILSTNGLLLSEKNIDLISEVVDEIDLSLDGYEKEHDIIRGVKCWEKSLNAIKLATSTNATTFVCSCVSQPLLNKLDDFIEMIQDMGVDCLKLAQIGEVGRKKTPDYLKTTSMSDIEYYNIIQSKIYKYRTNKFKIYQSLSLNPVMPNIREDGLVSDPRGKLFPMIGLLPDYWSVGEYKEGKLIIDEDKSEEYYKIISKSLQKGKEKTAKGTPVNWWTLHHDYLESNINSIAV